MRTNFEIRMKIRIIAVLLLAFLLGSCGEYNKILKSKDPDVKYAYAEKYFEEKKYGRTIELLENIRNNYKGSIQEQKILYLTAQAYFYDKDYFSATSTYKEYYTKYPRGEYVELARYNAAYGMYIDSPDPRLDQTSTREAMSLFSEFTQDFPLSEKTPEAQKLLFELQDKLAYKELLSVRLYYNLGLYMGNNYEASIITAKEALKTYSLSKYVEEFQIYLVRNKYELAKHSLDEKKPVRYRELLDEYYNYKNMFPIGNYIDEAYKYYETALKELGEEVDQLKDEVVKENVQ